MHQRTQAYIGLLFALFAIWMAYHPGLAGGFLFDDFGNLPSLGETGPIDNAPALARYLTSGTADPIGRPITVASFLIDARDWPADPGPFKQTNLLIHLFNTFSLACLLTMLGKRSKLNAIHARNTAVLGAALWGLHPLFVSTTLYIVQREAMLPASFTLAALMLWLTGRDRLMNGQTVSGLTLELMGLGLGTTLATLSKANGALLPFYALLIEHILLRPNDVSPRPRAHVAITWMLWLPVLAVLAYLTHTAIKYLGAPPPYFRDWTVGQRLLTEPRVLWTYLSLLWLPHPFTAGLFNDQVQASTGLLQPLTTLPALLGVVGLIAVAWRIRQRHPIWAVAILFFFTGHLIESSVVPLELYFEHRNYLPALLMFWPMAIWLTNSGRMHSARIALALVILCGLTAMTYANARVWGNTTEQALLWAKLNPESPRAQANAAQIMMSQNQPAWAQTRLRTLLKKKPNELQITFNLLGADCQLDNIPAADLEATRQALSQTRQFGELSYKWFTRAIEKAKNQSCADLTLPVVQSLLDAALRNPAVSQIDGCRQNLLNIRGKLALASQQPQLAYQYFAESQLIHPAPSIALEQAATLGTAGEQRLGLCALALWEKQVPTRSEFNFTMPRLHEWILKHQNYWPKEVAHLKKALQKDLPVGANALPCPELMHPTQSEMTP